MKPEFIQLLEAELQCDFKEVSLPKIIEYKPDEITEYAIDGHGNITGICIVKLSLRKIPDQFHLRKEFVKHLTHLNLYNNQLMDISSLAGLTSLTRLDLSYNQLTDISFLADLTSLTQLLLFNNQLTDISSLAGLTNLIRLDLSYNQLMDISSLTGLISLTELNLSSNQLTDISFLADLHSLTGLYVSGNQLTDISPLAGLNSLTRLWLYNNQINSISSLEGLTGLTKLLLYNNQLADISSLADMKSLAHIDLSRNQLVDISALAGLSSLTWLSLYNNQLMEISSLASLTSLLHLDLSRNQLVDISFLAGLTSLTELLLYNNLLTNISSLARLTSLTELLLYNNQLTDITSLADLTSLTTLKLYNNRIKDISSLSSLTSLTRLDLSGNQLTDISSLAGLTSLIRLDLSGNQLTEISPIKGLGKLTRLDLQKNSITILYEWICDFPEMEIQWEKIWDSGFITINDNPLISPPAEIVQKGKNALKEWFLQTKKYGKEKAWEAKILIVGEPGSGKTTLLRKLFDPAIEVPSKEGEQLSTLGVEIIQNRSFSYTKEPGIEISAHIWDFGGQDIQYALHQYFITDNSLYILLSDGRKDNTRYDYWFQTIQLLSRNSPVLVCINKKEGAAITPFDRLNYTRLFSQLDICDLEVDFRKNDLFWDHLLNTIAKKLSELLVVGRENPKVWKTVKDRLDEIREKSKYISLERYLEICTESGIDNEDDALFLLSYLHDIGIALNFKGDSNLANMVFLDPNWITKAIYQVLSDDNIEKQNGTFQKEWLFRSWKAKDYRINECNHLLNLMLKNKFNICYEMEGKADTFIVPLKLPQKIPPYTWNPKDNLNFRYQYPFMPEGILSQLIVHINEHIEEHLVWGKGVVIRKNSCRAEIQQTYNPLSGLKYIGIRVAGEKLDARKDMLKNVRYEMNKIHRNLFPTMKVSELVVCNCKYCTESEDPNFYEYSELEELMGMGDVNKSCTKGKQRIPIKELIDATFSSDEFNEDGKRITPVPPDTPVPFVSLKRKILFLSANPSDQKVRPQVDKEFKSIKDELQSSDHWEAFELLPPELGVTDKNLLKSMNQKPEIVHFAGHGELEGIVITDHENRSVLMPEKALNRLFKQHKDSIRLVILSACYSSEQAQTISAIGFYVIGMNSAFKDVAALSFSTGLYIGLGAGKEIESAYDDAMFMLESNFPGDAEKPEIWKDGKILNL
jgi:internalin A